MGFLGVDRDQDAKAGTRGADSMVMMVETLALIALAGLGGGWWLDRRRLVTRLAEGSAMRALSVDLALWWRARSSTTVEAREEAAGARRNVERIAVLARLLHLDPETTAALQLAAAVPPGMLAERDVRLGPTTRAALTLRHARWDGMGIPRGVKGDNIPIEAQVLGVADWLEVREGSPAHSLEAGLRAEGGARFGKELAELAATHARTLAAVGSPEVIGGLRVTRGALLCITPEKLDAIEREGGLEARQAALRAVEEFVRGRLRPTDRVRCTDREIVAWLKDANADGALAVIKRLEPALRAVPLTGEIPAVSCTVGVSLADSDATSFAELLSVARGRVAQKAA